MDEKIYGVLVEIRDELIFMNKNIQKQTEVLVRTRQGKTMAEQEELKGILDSIQGLSSGTPFSEAIGKVSSAFHRHIEKEKKDG